MSDPGLKLPSKKTLISIMWDTLGYRPTAEEIDRFYAALTADAEKEVKGG